MYPAPNEESTRAIAIRSFMARNESGKPLIRIHSGAWFTYFASMAADHDNLTVLAGGCP
jgi:hypothetical protein